MHESAQTWPEHNRRKITDGKPQLAGVLKRIADAKLDHTVQLRPDTTQLRIDETHAAVLGDAFNIMDGMGLIAFDGQSHVVKSTNLPKNFQDCEHLLHLANAGRMQQLDITKDDQLAEFLQLSLSYEMFYAQREFRLSDFSAQIEPLTQKMIPIIGAHWDAVGNFPPEAFSLYAQLVEAFEAHWKEREIPTDRMPHQMTVIFETWADQLSRSLGHQRIRQGCVNH